MEIKTFLAVGNIGLEGGGEIKNVLVESLKDFKKFFVGCYLPKNKEEVVKSINFLLSHNKSAMLTIYKDALMGRFGIKEYNILYLKKKVHIMNYHQYLFVFDAIGVGFENKLCNLVRKFKLSGLRKLKKINKIDENKTEIFDKLCRDMVKKKFYLRNLIY